mmetsp:Transcript_40549/g.82909  ORF Transcript_40549/g.82909 Transcript_40549/m.82909 type:complete len:98 (+) Transcript_40549:92-385(+)
MIPGDGNAQISPPPHPVVPSSPSPPQAGPSQRALGSTLRGRRFSWAGLGGGRGLDVVLRWWERVLELLDFEAPGGVKVPALGEVTIARLAKRVSLEL